jgi:hypothetical protein
MAKTNRTKTNKYPNGYAPKIQYWANKLAEVNTAEDRYYTISKLEYFLSKERARIRVAELNEYSDGEDILRYMGG